MMTPSALLRGCAKVTHHLGCMRKTPSMPSAEGKSRAVAPVANQPVKGQHRAVVKRDDPRFSVD